jgi:hypothetical protein
LLDDDEDVEGSGRGLVPDEAAFVPVGAGAPALLESTCASSESARRLGWEGHGG